MKILFGILLMIFGLISVGVFTFGKAEQVQKLFMLDENDDEKDFNMIKIATFIVGSIVFIVGIILLLVGIFGK